MVIVSAMSLVKHVVLSLFVTTGVFFFLASTGVVQAGDVSLPGNHPLNQVQSGDLLIAELRCAACHDDINGDALPEKIAPSLTEVGDRISPDYLRQYLAAPSMAHPGTTMPDLLASRSEAERAEIAEALTHFLVAQSRVGFLPESPDELEIQQGKVLFHSVGCVACHGPLDATAGTAPSRKPIDDFYSDDEDEVVVHDDASAVKPVAIQLGHVARKYSVDSLSKFLFQPLLVRSSGRMPDMKLTRAESLAIAGYLMEEQSQSSAALNTNPSLIVLGRKYFEELNCAACHALDDIPKPQMARSLSGADLSQGCLSKSSTESPRYDLDEAELLAIQAALNAAPAVESDELMVAKTLTAFNCIACHIRDDFGGVHESHNAFFTASEQNLGDDGRIPPPLTLIGAKLQPAWMKKVLFDGESVRHYMTTRMPQYGAANLQHLPDILGRIDVLENGREMTIPSSESRTESERAEEKLMRAAGRELLGDKGVNCVACHQFNGKAAIANQGMELMTSYQRLQPAWFHSYLRNPNAFRPRTVMPTAWPDGVAAFTSILDGDTDKQIEAIWYYLSLGTSAADPSGVRAVSTKLSVDDQAQTYRGRSRVAGFRGIAVGLPGGVNYAFNAETGTLAAIWQGEFITVNWSGQGSGDFNPAGPTRSFAQDVSFMQLDDEEAPWPLMPVMTKESRTNPDPLYPKNVGYQFRGYELGESLIPTFKYRSGMVEIADRSTVVGEAQQRQLSRVLQFNSPQAQTIWFRVLTGDIATESERVFVSDRLRLKIPAVETKLRPLLEDPMQSELLLRLQLPQGQSTLEFVYEPINQ